MFLQVFLFLFADRRKHSTSGIQRLVLWLAYLSADSVAIFVLGHLAVRVSNTHEQGLMAFWAPFVLIHLGGQETMTAFSMQDNELWKRHLLNLFIQTAVAGYIVGKATWPDNRLRTAMVLIFISGFIKYGGRTMYLYYARPKFLTSTMSWRAYGQGQTSYETMRQTARQDMEKTIDRMSKGGSVRPKFMEAFSLTTDIMAVDAPLNTVRSITLAGKGELHGMLAGFLCRGDRHNAYKHVEALLVQCYSRLYTKGYGREVVADCRRPVASSTKPERGSSADSESASKPVGGCQPSFDEVLSRVTLLTIIGGPTLFPYAATLVALVLFVAADKGEALFDNRRGRADIMVSYLLLIGAVALDVSSVVIYMFSRCFYPRFNKKTQWSQKLKQYTMINSAEEDSSCRVICQILGGDLLETKELNLSVHMKEFILDNLLESGKRQEWHIASTRGHLALLHRNMTTIMVLEESVRSGVDFPRCVLIWHIATEICFHYDSRGDKEATITSYSDELSKKPYKQMSRELSNYIMYLVFKCRVMLTTYSNVVHDQTRQQIVKILSPPQSRRQQVINPSELLLSEEIKIDLEGSKEQDEHTRVIDSDREPKAKEQDEIVEIEHEEMSNNNLTTKVHMKKVSQSAESLYSSPVLPAAREVARQLIRIEDEAQRWDLIAAVWAEMLYYTAPRCGAAFHAEHLATGGEFITHVFVLMYLLGPFMPAPGA
ncbi:hypothetical protein HU200_067632 [Digitaria exilis]|uniref:DUF4220 domain-containing protein n=1 Tax=Digitaria exilis TaxID=1010633 RepID=A0A834ZW31_9POAL|nr:hypothetical protein HU200_067632 [Digitaria exilis]